MFLSSARRCASSSVVLSPVSYVVAVSPLLRLVVVGYRLTGAKGPVSGRPPLNGNTYLKIISVRVGHGVQYRFVAGLM